MAELGTFDELLDAAMESLHPIMRKLREAILDVDPDAVEVVRLGDRAATYGVGPKKMTEGFAYILPYKKWVNLGFYKGVDLPDRNRLLEGTGAKMRHYKVRTLEDAARPEVKALLKAAVAERKNALKK